MRRKKLWPGMRSYLPWAVVCNTKTSVAFQLVLDVFHCPFGILFCEP